MWNITTFNYHFLIMWSWFSDFSLTDHGGNVAHENSGCNGVWIDRGLRSCIPFLYNSVTATNVTAVETAPVGGIEYFNYNESDKMYGPTNWGRVRNNAEYLRYNELKGTLKRSLVNKCNRKSVSQSPIDLCDDKINNECYEHHQTRSHVSTLSNKLLVIHRFGLISLLLNLFRVEISI